MKNKKYLAALLAIALSSPAMAVTIVNNNTQSIRYTIATNGFMTTCDEGSVGVGGNVSWLTAGSKWLHPFCGGEGPTHVEITVTGLSPLPTNCTPHNSHNPRLTNKTAVVKVAASQYGVECYLD